LHKKDVFENKFSRGCVKSKNIRHFTPNSLKGTFAYANYRALRSPFQGKQRSAEPIRGKNDFETAFS